MKFSSIINEGRTSNLQSLLEGFRENDKLDIHYPEEISREGGALTRRASAQFFNALKIDLNAAYFNLLRKFKVDYEEVDDSGSKRYTITADFHKSDPEKSSRYGMAKFVFNFGEVIIESRSDEAVRVAVYRGDFTSTKAGKKINREAMQAFRSHMKDEADFEYGVEKKLGFLKGTVFFAGRLSGKEKRSKSRKLIDGVRAAVEKLFRKFDEEISEKYGYSPLPL